MGGQLRAVPGVVLGMQVHALRSVIKPADALMFIIPQENDLVIKTQALFLGEGGLGTHAARFVKLL